MAVKVKFFVETKSLNISHVIPQKAKCLNKK